MAFDDGWSEKRRVLALLQARGLSGVTTAELSDPAVGGHEGPRRVRQLRAEGHPVQRARIPGSGYWRYWLGESPRGHQLDLFWEDE